MYGVELYRDVRLAVVDEGLSHREAARRFGIDRRTVKKMLSYSAPPGYRRSKPVQRPKLESFTGIIDGILAADRNVPRKQRHTAQRIFERLRDEHGFSGGYTIVKEYVRERRLTTREVWMGMSARLRSSAGFRARSSTTTPPWRWRASWETASAAAPTPLRIYSRTICSGIGLAARARATTRAR